MSRSVTCSRCGKLGSLYPTPSGRKWVHRFKADDRAHLFVPAPLRAPSESEQQRRDEERVREMRDAGVLPDVAQEDFLSGDADDGTVPADAF